MLQDLLILILVVGLGLVLLAAVTVVAEFAPAASLANVQVTPAVSRLLVPLL